MAAGLREALESTDACVITTNAPEFEAVPDELEAIGGSDYVVVDARRLLDPLSFTGPVRRCRSWGLPGEKRSRSELQSARGEDPW